MLNEISQRQVILGQLSSSKMGNDLGEESTFLLWFLLSEDLFIPGIFFFHLPVPSALVILANIILFDLLHHCHVTSGKSFPVVQMSTKYQFVKKTTETITDCRYNTS